MRTEKYLPIIPTFILLLPFDARACMTCGREMLYYDMPYLGPVLFILFLWRIIYGIFQLKTYPKFHFGSPMGFITTRVICMGCLLFMAVEAGCILYLTASYIKAPVVFIVAIVRRTKGKTPPEIIKHAKTFQGAIHLCALLLIVPVICVSQHRFNQEDDLGKLQKYVIGGGPVARSLAVKIGRDPDFDVERLREMLKSEDYRDLSKAFHILDIRKNLNDLDRFKFIVAEYYDRDPSFRNKYNPVYQLEFWLSSLNVPKDIKTKQQFVDWIDEKSKAARTAASKNSPNEK